jgi:hypothetical protein
MRPRPAHPAAARGGDAQIGHSDGRTLLDRTWPPSASLLAPTSKYAWLADQPARARMHAAAQPARAHTHGWATGQRVLAACARLDGCASTHRTAAAARPHFCTRQLRRRARMPARTRPQQRPARPHFCTRQLRRRARMPARTRPQRRPARPPALPHATTTGQRDQHVLAACARLDGCASTLAAAVSRLNFSQLAR